MDRFRALEYFVAAAEEGSLSGAARRLEVTIPAALKVINSLERHLGASLFDRSSRGLKLTADGARYLESCKPLLDQLSDADEEMRSAGNRPRGTVVLGAPEFAQVDMLPALPQFHARFPDIALDMRTVNRLADPESSSVDVFVLYGWHEAPDMIHRRIAQTSYHVVATPAYWASHGMPQRPRDLAEHHALVFRNPEGTLLDFWEFDRGSESESVTVKGWLASTNPEVVLRATLCGEGIARQTYLRMREFMRRGELLTAMDDWRVRHPPPVTLFFRPKHRRTARVRLVVDFLVDLYRRLEADREQGVQLGDSRPDWYYKQYSRASRAAS